MKKHYLFRCLLFVITISIVSCDKDDIIREAQVTSAVPFTIKTITKEELIRSNAASGSIFSEVTKLEERSLQKSLDSLHGFKILTELVKVIEKPDDSLTTYTFPTINFRDNKLKNVVVTEKNGAFATYIVSYETLSNGSTKIEQRLVSNDSSGLAKDFITITYTYCQWISFQSPRDFTMGEPEWVCETKTETFFFGDSGGGGSAGGGSTGGGPSGGGTQGGNDGSGNDGSGTWGSSPGGGGGGGGGGGMTIITQPTYASDIAILKNFTDNPSIKADLVRMRNLSLQTGNEEGTEWRIAINNSYTPFRQVPDPSRATRDAVPFGTPSLLSVLRTHLHPIDLLGVPSIGDLYGFTNFYLDRANANNPVSLEQTTAMLVSASGYYAIRMKPVVLLSDLQDFVDDGRMVYSNGNYKGFKVADVAHLVGGWIISDKAQRLCNCEKGDPGWDAAQDQVFIDMINNGYSYFFTIFKANNQLTEWTAITN